MKAYADKKRAPHPFKLGDYVFVKLRPYRQASLGEQKTHKLSKRYYGPFKLIKQICDVAFELELPPTSKIHPVFHVSQLKPCHNAAVTPNALPYRGSAELPQPPPVAILDWKHTADSKGTQVLVQWAGLFPEDATWESQEELLK